LTRAGPKREVTAGPLDLSPLRRLNRADRAIAFIEHFLRIPRGKDSLAPVVLREWQRTAIQKLLADGNREGLLLLPRGNGKTSLAAMLGLFALFGDEEEGAEVLAIASSEDQARICFNAARRMVELSPELSARSQIFTRRIYVPETDSSLMVLPSEGASLQGYAPSFVILDELHVVQEDTYEALSLAAGKRERSMLLGISTAGESTDSVLWRLREAGQAGDLALVEFAAPFGCEADDRAAWKMANPALGDFLSEDALVKNLQTVRESSFRRYRLNQWVSGESAWLPFGTWEALENPLSDVGGSRVVLGFDGSTSGDATALIAATIEPSPYVFTVGIWQDPEPSKASTWRVPRDEVSGAVARAFDAFDVVELVADPWEWRQELEIWRARYGENRVLEFPTNSVSRMAPATDEVRTAIMEKRISHDGNEVLSSHIGNTVARTTAAGDVVSKDKKSSPRKIDGAIATIIAVHRALWHSRQVKRRSRVIAI